MSEQRHLVPVDETVKRYMAGENVELIARDYNARGIKLQWQSLANVIRKHGLYSGKQRSKA